ncbi:MAG: hypothetical protein H6555_10140 [Lewinellaceae bacterium]|nr:hypothetical protein [Lewinellaceae bacterium]
MKKFLFFALFCSFSLLAFANNNQMPQLEESGIYQQVDASVVAIDLLAETCTVKTKTTITKPDGTKTTVESETTINMSCAELVKTAIKALQ